MLPLYHRTQVCLATTQLYVFYSTQNNHKDSINNSIFHWFLYWLKVFTVVYHIQFNTQQLHLSYHSLWNTNNTQHFKYIPFHVVHINILFIHHFFIITCHTIIFFHIQFIQFIQHIHIHFILFIQHFIFPLTVIPCIPLCHISSVHFSFSLHIHTCHSTHVYIVMS